jgi:hypothetical protein
MAMRQGNITEDELVTIKNYQTGIFAYSLENPQTKANFAINIERYDLDDDYYENYLKKIEDVELEDVKEISKKYIFPSGYILVVGNQEEVADKVKALSPTGTIQFYDAYGNEAEESALKPAPAGMTAEKVVHQYLDAIGGRKKAAEVKSYYRKENATIQGMSLTNEEYKTSEGKYKMVLSMNGMEAQKQVYDGSKGISMARGQSAEMTEEEMTEVRNTALIFPELQFEQKNYQTELKGVDVNTMGEETYVVEVTYPNGDKESRYYATDDQLLLGVQSMQETPQGTFMVEYRYSDYKEVNGLKMPFGGSGKQGPMAFDIEVETYELNKNMAEDTFKVE